MIKVSEKEIRIIQNANNRKLAIEELLDKALMHTKNLRNKELLYTILDEYVKMSQVIDMWWEKIGKKYSFDYMLPCNVNYKTRVITLRK